MARPPYSGTPEVQQQGPVDAFEHTQATPQEFGAGIGQAEEGLGQTLQRTSDAVAQNALRMQEQINSRDANQQLNGYMTDAGKEMAKYNAMEGQAKSDYYPTFQQNLAALRDQYGANLQSPAARLEYDNNSRFMTTRYYTMGAEGAAQGLKESYKTTAAQSMETYTGQGILAASHGDMTTVALMAAKTMDTARNTATQLGGNTLDQAENAAKMTYGLYYQRVLHGMVEAGNIGGASALYGRVKDNLDGESVSKIDQMMKPANDRFTGDALANDAYNQTVGGTSSTPDPVVRGTIVDTAKRSGLDPAVPLTIAQIESRMGGAPDSPGNSHKGVFQLGDQEWSQIGGTAANRGDKTAQAALGTQWVAGAQKAASDALGRPAEGWETYLVHQQGSKGGPALLTAAPGESAIDALTPAYGGDRDRATRAITNNGGSPNMSAQQFTQLWQAKYARAAGTATGNSLPTSGDAREPLTGDQILAATDSLANNTTATPEALAWAQRRLEIRLNAYNQALKADAEHAIDGIATKVLQNPHSVSLTDIATNPALTGPEKFSMANELTRYQTGKSQGDGDGFADVINRIQRPIGDPQRLNSDRDLLPLMGREGGLTFPGLDKAMRFLKDRDAPDGPALTAATDRWKKLILYGGDTESGAAASLDESDATRAKWSQFLAVLPEILQQNRGKMSMSELVSDNGPVMKVIKGGNFIPKPEDVYQNAVQPAPQQGFLSKLLWGPSTNAAPAAPAASGIVGHWYIPEGAAGYKEVPPGTPGARRLVAPELRARNFQSAEAPQ